MELKHFKKDLRRLTDSRNKVERGYLLFFVRREDYHKKSKMHPVIDRLPDVLKREVEENQEPTTNLVVLYLESPSPGSSRKEVIPKDRSAWVGFWVDFHFLMISDWCVRAMLARANVLRLALLA